MSSMDCSLNVADSVPNYIDSSANFVRPTHLLVKNIAPPPKLNETWKYPDYTTYSSRLLSFRSWPKASVTIVAGFCPEFHPPFLWCSKHQTRMTLNINNLVPSEFLNRSSRSVRSLISTLICI